MTTALAFKVQAEPGWRGVCIALGDPIEDHPGHRYCTITIHNIGYWGLFLHSRTVSPLDGLSGLFGSGLFGGGGPEFKPLDSDGKGFEDLRRIVSPAETISNDELLADAQLQNRR
jgi:hypothetical protein